MAAVEFEVDGHIALVTLNRPEARNSFNPEALVRLYDAFHEVEKTTTSEWRLSRAPVTKRSVRVLILVS